VVHAVIANTHARAESYVQLNVGLEVLRQLERFGAGCGGSAYVDRNGLSVCVVGNGLLVDVGLGELHALMVVARLVRTWCLVVACEWYVFVVWRRGVVGNVLL